MKYTTRLPAAHIGGDALDALEEALLSGCTAPHMEIELEYGRVTYRCSSLSAIREDTTLPDVVKSFEVTLTSSEGQVDLVADDQDDEFTLRLTGNRSWVEAKRRSIEGFFETHGATARTFLERYMAFCLGFAATGLGLALYYSGLGELVGMGTPVDSLLFGSLALIGGGVLHLLLNVVYPYAALVTSARPDSPLVYLQR